MSIWTDAQSTIGQSHRFDDSVAWQLTVAGMTINGAMAAISTTNLSAMTLIYGSFGSYVSSAAAGAYVPIELLSSAIGMIVDVVGADAGLIQNYRYEMSGYVDDTTTPHLVAVGCTGILLSAAQTAMADPTITSAALTDPTTNLNACAAFIASTVRQNQLDPVYVAALYNQYGLLYSEASPWRMQRFDSDDTAIDRYVNWFNAAVSQQRSAPITGPDYATSLTALASVTLATAPVQQYHTVQAQQLIQQPVSVVSSGNAILTTYWFVFGPSWNTIVSVGVAYASGLGLPGGLSTTSLIDANANAVSVTGAQLTLLYNGLRTYVSAIGDYDTGVAVSLPTQPVNIA